MLKFIQFPKSNINILLSMDHLTDDTQTMYTSNQMNLIVIVSLLNAQSNGMNALLLII
jgi:hypothetical protein